MGREMAINLLKAGHAVLAYDVRPDAVADMGLHGATPCGSLSDATRAADLVITMLPDTPQVEEVLAGVDGIAHNPPAGRLVVDMSTISPQATRAMSRRLEQ